MTNAVSRCCAHTLLAVALALPFDASPQSQGALSATQDTFHLHGIVLDSHTGKPIARALVEAYNGRLATLTDHDGRFALTLHFTPVNGAAIAPYQRSLMGMGSLYIGLTVRKPGYSPQDNSQRQFQQVSLAALESDLVVGLTPQSAIQGRLATPVDDRPQGIRVSLLMRRVQNGSPVWSQTSMAVTDSRGEFRFGSLQPGHYRLLTQDWSDDPEQANVLAVAETTHPVSRYPPTGYPSAASGSDLRLTPGEIEQVNLNIHPQTYVPVRIPVALPEGSNPGMQVRVQRAGAPEGVNSGLSLRWFPREKAVQGILPLGQYEITLQANAAPNPAGNAASGSAAMIQLTVAGSRVETAPVTLQPMPSIPVIVHQDLTQFPQSGNASASPSSIIAGRVRNGEAEGMPVQVMLIPPPGTSQTVIAHRPNGSEDLVLEPVPPNSYRMEANAPEGYISAATSGGADLLRQPLVVTPGTAVEPIEITVRNDTATLRGTLDSAVFPSESGAIAASSQAPGLIDTSNFVLVACIPSQPNGQRLMQTVAQRDGTFVIRNLAPGSYRVYASRVSLDTLEYRGESFIRDYGSEGQPVTLEPNGNATVTLTSIIEELKDP